MPRVLIALLLLLSVSSSGWAMYSPTLGRFINRDPGPDGNSGVELERTRLNGTPGLVGNLIVREPIAGAGYQDGMSLYGAYFVPNQDDWSGTKKDGPERYFGLGVSGYGNFFFHLPWRNEDSGAWAAIDKGIQNGDLEDGDKIGHMIWARSRAKDAIEEWMKDDKSQGGCECKNIMIVAVSLGSTSAVSISEWFESKYGFKPRLFVMIEGVNHWTGPYSRMGNAEIKKNYYVGKKHWPSGMSLPGAENVDLQNEADYLNQLEIKNNSKWKEHIAAEWAGSDRAVVDIHAAKNPHCGH